MTVSRSIHVTANGIMSFFNGWVIFYCIYVSHFLHPVLSIGRCLGCFHVLVLVNSVSMNIGVYVSIQTMFSLDICPGVGSWGSSAFNLLRSLHTFLHDSATSLLSTNSEEGSLLSIPSPAFIVCGFFDDSHFDWSEVTSHCSFDLHFSNN